MVEECELAERVKGLTIDVADFPKAGILFRDVTPMLADGKVFCEVVNWMASKIRESGATKIVGAEARGLILGAAAAAVMGIGFVPARKGTATLPRELVTANYALEYGNAIISIHADGVNQNDKVAIVDDLLATGGTALAMASLVHQCKGTIASWVFVYELTDLKGAQMIQNQIEASSSTIHSLVKY